MILGTRRELWPKQILLCFKEAASTALLLIPNTQLFWQMINGLSLEVACFQLGQELQTHLGKGRRSWNVGLVGKGKLFAVSLFLGELLSGVGC